MDSIVIIGVDGGASKTSAWVIKQEASTDKFAITDVNVQRQYADYNSYDSGFQPLSVQIQIAQLEEGIQLAEEEIRQSDAYMSATLDVLIEIMNKFKGEKIIVGIGMPGLKTNDKRGISVLANGPRMPRFSAYIENKLKGLDLHLHMPIARLGSDADYCGIGEEYAEKGLFKHVTNAYYLGGGTGVADALKLRGELVPFDKVKTWIAKSWEMKSTEAYSLEKYASARGIQYLYSEFSKTSVQELDNKQIFPMQIFKRALAKEQDALDTIASISTHIALLLFERISTLYKGWSGLFTFVNPKKVIENKNHPYTGTLLQKIIFGQRLGELIKYSQDTDLLWSQILFELSDLVKKESDEKFKNHYLVDGRFNPDLIEVSRLREAPALGAGIDAFLHCKKNKLC